MAEKLIIKNFAGIKELELEVKRINILIGPQASGKSVCAKLLYYFKNFVWEIWSTVENQQTKRNLDLNYSKTFEEYFPVDSWGKHDFFIRYEVADIFIVVSRKQDIKSRISLNYSDFFKKEFVDLRSLVRKANNSYSDMGESEPFDLYLTGRLLRERWADSLSASLGKEGAFTQLFIPAGRSFFATLESNIFSFLSISNALDPFLRAFGSTYESIKNTRISKDKFEERKDIQSEVNRLVEKALCGKHVREKGRDFLEISDGRLISVSHSSSGQQETLPLTIMLAALPSLTASRFGQTVYIEEPEAHLFPDAQRNVIELIATVFNYRKEQLQFFITTHSPYILTSINNLLQAGLIYEDAEQDILFQLEKIVPRYKALNPADLSAYLLESGHGKSIICPDTGLIDAKAIDSVSDDLAIQFDKLLDLA
jgi:hypothetical protein